MHALNVGHGNHFFRRGACGPHWEWAVKSTGRAVQKGVNVEASITGNMKETSIALLEGVSPGLQTVVRLTVGPTETN